ncbi:GH1 family beta-glucosidase [Enhydrobacter sp.]|jgi:beta-glucosidase|uniref:GH1 family beta-glucosidase n=1 Tax=Enhydrobacter sp. TaxID=1894999 RepID=UPI00262225C6|nr:GH1 family beta-glucosidase [Enhydrobacter sp.]WIM11904.1 MAG: beta-glucosidase [Enhydrobacter sp.]
MEDDVVLDRGGAPVAERRELPHDFVWGVSTSSYQIEGATDVDGRGPSVWDAYCRVPGHIANGDTGDLACDHYHRYAEDISLMRKLRVHAYRFSVAWPRVLPKGRGASNEAGLAFYDRLIDGLLAAGIEPWLCLYHWDLPQALQEEGGWLNRDIAGWYGDYAELVARRYGDRIRRFATFNEPSVFSLFGYGFAWHPPGLVDPVALNRAIHHVNLAHGRGVDVLRAHVPRSSIGAIHNVQPSRAAGPRSAADVAAAKLLDAYWNRAFPEPQLLGRYPEELARLVEPHMQAGDLDRICRPIDWFGVNHYSPIYAKAASEAVLGFAWADAPADVPRSPIGWQVDPIAFRDTLLDVWRRYRLPIYVTENGAGANESPDGAGEVVDHERVRYLKTYISALRDAVAAGADVRGYFVWSLLDNFEWGAGYANRFGLVYIDYPSQRRIPKESAHWYARMIRAEALRGLG